MIFSCRFYHFWKKSMYWYFTMIMLSMLSVYHKKKYLLTRSTFKFNSKRNTILMIERIIENHLMKNLSPFNRSISRTTPHMRTTYFEFEHVPCHYWTYNLMFQNKNSEFTVNCLISIQSPKKNWKKYFLQHFIDFDFYVIESLLSSWNADKCCGRNQNEKIKVFLSSLVDTRISIENNYVPCSMSYCTYCGIIMSRHFNWEFIGNVIEIFEEEFWRKRFLHF